MKKRNMIVIITMLILSCSLILVQTYQSNKITLDDVEVAHFILHDEIDPIESARLGIFVSGIEYKENETGYLVRFRSEVNKNG